MPIDTASDIAVQILRQQYKKNVHRYHDNPHIHIYIYRYTLEQVFYKPSRKPWRDEKESYNE